MMNKKKFTEGELVVLKSGSPPLVVSSCRYIAYDKIYFYKCVYTDEKGKIRIIDLNEVVLKKL